MARVTGSSPLARGLRHRGREHAASRRIIPARAGFTVTGLAARRGSTDHPRSRGVYATAFHTVDREDGSSPLARGLQTTAGQAAHDGGIIPARAGFTKGIAAKPINFRIIPARAGFTLLLPTLSTVSKDHPRSRGVYPSVHADCRDPAGSSPLARGLRRGVACPRRGWRIIPARAGFTSVVRAPEGRRTDHPRSRGVYANSVGWAAPIFGSSPLARGLRGPVLLLGGALRIIPARAGFTPHRGSRRWPRRDHPRSRGVYETSRESPQS